MRSKAAVLAFVSVLLSVMWALPGRCGEEEQKEMKPVLFVIDVQNIWMPMMAEGDREAAPEKINEIIALFREYDYPVIRVYHSDQTFGPDPGSEPFEFPASFDVNEDDPKVVKNFPSAFTGTDLEKRLRDDERNAVFLCGLSATGCVLATYHGAMDRHFTAIMVKESLLSHNADYTDVIEDISYSMTIGEIRKAFDESAED